MYKITFAKNAEKGILKLDSNSYKKAMQLIEELQEHPRTGTGKPKRLVGQVKEIWSRRITQKHRLVYAIEDDKVLILVLSIFGHYDDK